MAIWLFAVLAACSAELSYNRDVRPVLSDRCFACHGPDNNNRKANLRLDRDPGQAALQKVLSRIESPNRMLRMPPAYLGHEPLKPGEIALLRRWVAEGGRYEPHWSFIPPRKEPVPAGVSPIDYFVRRRLKAEGLSMSPPAAPHVLLRRVTLDLTGLPPSPEETKAFLADPSGTAYERLVDRLLASPRHAERMAVRWLEAARYADTNGYQTDGERSMWRWRDWVLEAYRRNMPFDQFTIEQLAGDLLPGATREQHIATGFHRNHRTSAEGGIIDEEYRVEYVADRTETTATVWLGLTVGCARCHDHKYDPISQKEYYQLFAFFNQMPEKGFVYNFGNEEPYIPAPTPEMEAKLAELDQQVTHAEAAWKQLEPEAERRAQRFRAPASWLPAEELVFRHPGGSFSGPHDGLTVGFEKTRLDYITPFTFQATINPTQPHGAILAKSEDYWEGSGHGLYLVDGKLRLHVVFRWTDLGMRLESAEPLGPGPHRIVVTYDGKRKPEGFRLWVDGQPRAWKVLFNELSWPIDSKEPFRIGAGGGQRFQGEIRDVAVWTRALTPDEVARPDFYAWLDLKAPRRFRAARAAWKSAVAAREAYWATIPTVMVLRDQPGIRKNYVLKRGAYDQPGEEVSPQPPAVLPPLPAGLPANRLGLARWLVSPDHPLTARVVVNRYWQMLFGTGLVKTVEDFGSQGEWPIYQDLLDWLAADFVEGGWDNRRLLKTIVMSETYRQSSHLTPELRQADPENRLLARGPRFRLPPEVIRDQALAASGLLVEKFGGPSVRPPQPPGLWNELAGGKDYVADTGENRYRRSLYTYWRRTIQPPLMITFDSPTRETCAVRENRTNTPLQALNLMNDETFLEAAAALGQRMEAAADPLAEGFLRVLARWPTAQERELLAAARARLNSWTLVASLILNLDEAITKP